VAKRFGVDHVAIATDLSYRSRFAGEESRKVPRRPPGRERWESLWPIPVQYDPAKLTTVQWTNWPLFTVGLVQRGYSDSDIQKIIGLNALRVARAALA
jgi:membrane dipeptidase